MSKLAVEHSSEGIGFFAAVIGVAMVLMAIGVLVVICEVMATAPK
jgi:hypothetical protein